MSSFEGVFAVCDNVGLWDVRSVYIAAREPKDLFTLLFTLVYTPASNQFDENDREVAVSLIYTWPCVWRYET